MENNDEWISECQKILALSLLNITKALRRKEREYSEKTVRDSH
jgi:hypothetical protein